MFKTGGRRSSHFLLGFISWCCLAESELARQVALPTRAFPDVIQGSSVRVHPRRRERGAGSVKQLPHRVVTPCLPSASIPLPEDSGRYAPPPSALPLCRRVSRQTQVPAARQAGVNSLAGVNIMAWQVNIMAGVNTSWQV